MLLNGVISKKINAGWKCRKTGSEECGCKNEKTCVWRGGCKVKNIVYKATCKQCGKFYIGNTQNKAKLRFTQHYASVGKKLKKGISDSRYAKHWASCYVKRYGTKVYDVCKVRDMTHHEIIYEANPLTAVKTYGRNGCRLCMEERLEIYKESCRNQVKMINKRKEIYNTCNHNVKFHHYSRNTEELTESSEKEFCQVIL